MRLRAVLCGTLVSCCVTHLCDTSVSHSKALVTQKTPVTCQLSPSGTGGRRPQRTQAWNFIGTATRVSVDCLCVNRPPLSCSVTLRLSQITSGSRREAAQARSPHAPRTAGSGSRCRDTSRAMVTSPWEVARREPPLLCQLDCHLSMTPKFSLSLFLSLSLS